MAGVRYTVHVRVKDGLEEKFLERYDALRRRVAEGLDGHVAHELCRDLEDPSRWLITSRWESLDASLVWESSEEHRALTLPMRECWDEAQRSGYAVELETVHPAF